MPNTTLDLSALASGATESAEKIERSRATKFADNPLRNVVRGSNGKTIALPPVAEKDVQEVIAYLRAAANELNKGLNVAKREAKGGKVSLRFALVAKRERKNPRKVLGKAVCPVCGKEVNKTADGKLRTHGKQDDRCKGSGQDAPAPVVEAPAENTAPDDSDHSTTDGAAGDSGE